MAEKEQQMSEGKKKSYKILLANYIHHRNWNKLVPYLPVVIEIKCFFLKGGRQRQNKAYHWSWDKHQSAQQGVQSPGSVTRAFHR